MNDWDIFMQGTRAWLTGSNPYQVPTEFPFVSPPWSLPIFTLLSWANWLVAMIFPTLALLFVAWRLRKPLLVPIVGLSFPFLMCTRNSNVDWMVMVGVVIGGRWGVILDSIKPQAGIFAIAAELGKCQTWRARLLILIPFMLIVLATSPLLISWLETLRNMQAMRWNHSMFPYTIPLGIVALYLAVKRGDRLWGVAASLSLSPYWFLASTLPLVCLIAIRNWKLGILVSIGTWLIYLPRYQG